MSLGGEQPTEINGGEQPAKSKSLGEFKTDYENFARQQIRIEGVLAYIAGEIKKLTDNS